MFDFSKVGFQTLTWMKKGRDDNGYLKQERERLKVDKEENKIQKVNNNIKAWNYAKAKRFEY